jgi:(E)-4-hydroxy-3-methylbut-2-enyl-diphosphate synthase
MSLNHIRPWRNIYRRKSRRIMVGNVPVGGDAPITVQTMTNTLTTDVKATVEQVLRAAEAGADIVRVSTPDEESTRALREIVRESPVPIVADIHFHYRRAIEAAEAGRPASGSTPATSATRSACARSSRRRRTTAARSGSA